MKNPEITDEISIIIRSSGERTEEYCFEIVKQQIKDISNIVIIRNLPFPIAHIKSIETAYEMDKNYSIFLDADIMLGYNAISKILESLNGFSDNFFMCNFKILDYQFGCPTYGVHAYKTKYLKQALQFKNESLVQQRPETFVINQMAKHFKIPSFASEVMVGLHGYEQSYEDMYRTMFVRAVKFSHRFEFLFERLYSQYKRNPREKDHQILFHALLDGTFFRLSHEKAPIDKEYYQEYYQELKENFQIDEKPPLAIDEINIEEIMDLYKPDELFLKNKSWLCPSGRITKEKKSIVRRVSNRFKKLIYKVVRFRK